MVFTIRSIITQPLYPAAIDLTFIAYVLQCLLDASLGVKLMINFSQRVVSVLQAIA